MAYPPGALGKAAQDLYFDLNAGSFPNDIASLLTDLSAMHMAGFMHQQRRNNRNIAGTVASELAQAEPRLTGRSKNADSAVINFADLHQALDGISIPMGHTAPKQVQSVLHQINKNRGSAYLHALMRALVDEKGVVARLPLMVAMALPANLTAVVDLGLRCLHHS